MGNSSSDINDIIPQIETKLINYNEDKITKQYYYKIEIKYSNYKWYIIKEYSNIKELRLYLLKNYKKYHLRLNIPIIKYKISLKEEKIKQKGQVITKYIQDLTSMKEIFHDIKFRQFIEIGKWSLNPTLGRKGKAGFLKKKSGGYKVKLSKTEDVLVGWSSKWVEAFDNCIIYHNPESDRIEGYLRIDFGLNITSHEKFIIIQTNTRKLTLRANSVYEAIVWRDSLIEFYSINPRSTIQPFKSSFPPRNNIDHFDIFTCTRDYYYNVARALLLAKEEILIAAWKLSPDLLLTHPPLPPIRLDHILKYKANQGVKICILLYQEVELAGQGNNSLKTKAYLSDLSSNINVIRHPNKIFGKSKAILWSHHEKLIIIDRSTAFIGGLDLASNRYDDFEHHLEDEMGVRFTGEDYRQNAPGLLKPVRPLIDQRNLGLNLFEISSLEKSFNLLEYETKSHLSLSRTTSLCHSSESFSSISVSEIDDVEDIKSYHIPNEAVNLLELQKLSFEEYDTEQNYNVEKKQQKSDQEHTSNFYTLEDTEFLLRDENITSISLSNRELYPRQGWHDVHSRVIGVTAKDLSSHFVQRWNFHRRSKNKLGKELLLDVADYYNFESCPLCGNNKNIETYLCCPSCGYNLALTEVEHKSFHSLSTFSYIDFDVSIRQPSGLTIYGNCPTVIEYVSEIPTHITKGFLTFSHGENYKELIDRGLYPSVGDVIIAIEGISTSHLSCIEIQTLIEKYTSKISNRSTVTITLRRHYLPELINIYSIHLKNNRGNSGSKRLLQTLSSDTSVECQPPHSPINFGFTIPPSGNRSFLLNKSFLGEEKFLTDDEDNDDDDIFEDTLGSPKHSISSLCMTPNKQKQKGQYLTWSPLHISETIFPIQKRKLIIEEIIAIEQQLNMNKLINEDFDLSNPFLLSPLTSNDTTQIQVLRSSSLWSVGEETECSIQNAYIDIIENSKHLIYIENQFFIGFVDPTLSEGTPHNLIVSALYKRLVKAIEHKEHFRVIILLPQHPSGDFLNHESPRIIYHFEYISICKGSNSLIGMLQAKFPEVNPYDYVSIHCLRNWAIMNEKIVSEQIYIHDKVLIVDDQVAIIGSANLNDRSMMGNRDSEIAIKIIDTFEINIQLAGNDWKAGKLIHNFRINLMKQHLGDTSITSDHLSDMSIHDKSNFTPFHKYWKATSDLNSSVYDWIDGEDVSIYRCRKLLQLKNGLKYYEHKSANDIETMEKVGQIQGFLINWPINFLQDENLISSTFTSYLTTDIWL